MEQELNRIKLVLVLKKQTGKWLAEQMQVCESTVSRWCSNAVTGQICVAEPQKGDTQ